MANKILSLTKIRRATLEALESGQLLEINSMNEASIDGIDVASVTRYFLTENRLVTRKDKSKAITTKGNGFTITEKGRSLLKSLPPIKNPHILINNNVVDKSYYLQPPTSDQLTYAKKLNLAIPSNVTKEEITDLISIKLGKDKPASNRHKEFAKIYKVRYSNYVGKKTLFNSIFYTLTAKGREKDLVSWFSFRVYRNLVKGSVNTHIQQPNDPFITRIAEKFSRDEKIIRSIHKYRGKDLIWFGEWTSPDGSVYQGGSKNTMAYKFVAKEIKKIYA